MIGCLFLLGSARAPANDQPSASFRIMHDVFARVTNIHCGFLSDLLHLCAASVSNHQAISEASAIKTITNHVMYVQMQEALWCASC